MQVGEIADELYAVPPEEFIAERTARQDEAKAAGDKALAKQIGALPKPSTAAWLCNLLVRAHSDEIQGLVELGDLLRDAQANLAGDELKALNRQRSQLISALSRQAAALGRERGHAVSTAVAGQVEETLRAGMADPEAGQALLAGRLTTAMSYSGMGTTVPRASLRLVHPPKPAPRAPARAPRAAAPSDRRREAEERRREAEERRRRELEQAREAADAAAGVADQAGAAAEEARRAVDELDGRRTRLWSRVEELAEELARAEEAAEAAAKELERAQRRRRTAEREADDAVAAREAADARVADLEDGAPGGGA